MPAHSAHLPPSAGRLAVIAVAFTVALYACSAAQQDATMPMQSSHKNQHLQGKHLNPCPGKPNCVSSDGSEQGKSYVRPFVITGSSDMAWQELQEIIVGIGGKIEFVENYFLHATFRSRIFRFVDDVTCRRDDSKGVIHIRSASRVGYSDFGVNRKRVETMRKMRHGR